MRQVPCQSLGFALAHHPWARQHTGCRVVHITTSEWEWLSGADSCLYCKQLRRYYSTTTPAVSIGKLLPLTAGRAGHGDGPGARRSGSSGTPPRATSPSACARRTTGSRRGRRCGRWVSCTTFAPHGISRCHPRARTTWPPCRTCSPLISRRRRGTALPGPRRSRRHGFRALCGSSSRSRALARLVKAESAGQ